MANQYPLYEHSRDTLRLPNGRPISAVSLEALRCGDVGSDAIGIRAETLLEQARIAAESGFAQLAENLRRAAELASVPDEEVLKLYEALRPGRSTSAELEALATHIETQYAAPLTAAFFREAAAFGVSPEAS